MTRWAALLLVAALAACGKAPTVLDGGSRQSFDKTAEQARRDLPMRDRLTFDAALKSPPGASYATKDKDRMRREAYNGMTAADVVADARAGGME